MGVVRRRLLWERRSEWQAVRVVWGVGGRWLSGVGEWWLTVRSAGAVWR